MTAPYTIREDGYDFATIEADDGDEALEMAEGEYLSSGSYDTTDGTVWVTWYAIDSDGDRVASRTMAVDPPEPKCTEVDHDWQSPYELVGGIRENPGVWGHGGGVVSHDVCVHCGCERVTDTWAQNPSTGEQGLRSVAYERGKYEDEVRAMREEVQS